MLAQPNSASARGAAQPAHLRGQRLVGHQHVDRVGERGRVAGRNQQAGLRRPPPPRGCRRPGSRPPRCRRPWPPGSRCRAARTGTGRRTRWRASAAGSPRAWRASRRSRSRRTCSPAAAAASSLTSASSSGVSAWPAQITSCAAGSRSAAARSSTGSPFCRVTRPTKMTEGRPGSTPYRSSTSVAGSGEYSTVSMPLRMTRTRSAGTAGYAASTSCAHAVGDRDDRVRGLHGRPLAPGGQRVAAAELLGLPGPQRLQRVDGDHVRDPVEQRGQVTGQVRVPGVRVDQVGGGHRGRHRQVRGDRLQRLVRAREVVPGPVRDRPRPVRALAVHGEVHQAGQLAGEVLHVHAGPAVDLRRVLPGQQRHAGACRGGRRSQRHHLALADHGDAARRHGEPAGPVAFLVHADLSALGDDHVLVQDRVLDHGVAADLGVVQQHRPLHPGPAVDPDPGREHRVADQARRRR